jgi:hypothetical protein
MEARARDMAVRYYWMMPTRERAERLHMISEMIIADQPELAPMLEVAVELIEEQIERLDEGEGAGHG